MALLQVWGELVWVFQKVLIYTTISRVYNRWSWKKIICSWRQFSVRKWLVDVRGQSRIARLLKADKNNHSSQPSYEEEHHWAHNRQKNRKLRLHKRTVKDWRNVAWSSESPISTAAFASEFCINNFLMQMQQWKSDSHWTRMSRMNPSFYFA